MRYLVSSAVFGLIPVPPEVNASSGERGNLHVIHGDVQHPQGEHLSSENTERLATKAERAILNDTSSGWGRALEPACRGTATGPPLPPMLGRALESI